MILSPCLYRWEIVTDRKGLGLRYRALFSNTDLKLPPLLCYLSCLLSASPRDILQ